MNVDETALHFELLLRRFDASRGCSYISFSASLILLISLVNKFLFFLIFAHNNEVFFRFPVALDCSDQKLLWRFRRKPLAVVSTH
ncbi:MAG: hypothetical protein ACI9BW_002535 [Gammaproteobacteria bacterium]|jgi:hypothetical protein